jgi:hypothetical protein
VSTYEFDDLRLYVSLNLFLSLCLLHMDKICVYEFHWKFVFICFFEDLYLFEVLQSVLHEKNMEMLDAKNHI